MIAAAAGRSRRVLALVPLGLEDVSDPFAPLAVACALASRCGARAEAVILGDEPQEADGREALASGAHAAWVVSHPELRPRTQPGQLVAAFAEALSHPDLSAAEPASLLLLPAGPTGEEIAGRLAMRIGAVPLGRCTRIDLTDEGVAIERPAYGARAQITLVCLEGPCVGAVRRTSADASRFYAQIDVRDPGARVTRLRLERPLPATGEVTYCAMNDKLPAVEGAKVVVCGGRGMAGPKGFGMLQDLAASLGGALGGSLPSVDAGWVPVSRQVGQSGKYVTAELYLAVGISGTPQHMAGVSPHTRIVAINSDPQADIFRFAEIGLVADWNDVLPALTRRLREARA